jgi:tRNA threonylcarbamoyladenosine biosynthesis protein TsaB
MENEPHTQSAHRAAAILALDTSTEWAGIALGAGNDVQSRVWHAGRTQTTSVLPAIDEMCREVGIAPSELGAVAVATGPGTFTGLRVGMSIAKGIVLAGGIPLVGIPTLEITAAAVTDAMDLVAVLPAGRGRVVWQRFRAGQAASPRNSTLDELVDALREMPEALVAGELAEAQRERVEAEHAQVRWEPRDPVVLLHLARERLARGEVGDPVTLEPTYLHGVTVAAGPIQDRMNKKDR